MGGQKNWRILRIVVGSLCILAVVYLLYSHRQTHNELQMKNRYLDVAEEEYKTLTKRFDMLGNELKSAVQTSADLDKQLRNERSAHSQTTKEKEEFERECQMRETRKETEKAQLVKEKELLSEEKDQMKRERDRLSSRYEALTQECHETQEHAANHQRELQHTCDENLNQCNTRIAKFERDATTCHNSLLKSSKDLSACNNELHSATERCRSQQAHQEEQLNRQHLGERRRSQYDQGDDHYNEPHNPWISKLAEQDQQAQNPRSHHSVVPEHQSHLQGDRMAGAHQPEHNMQQDRLPGDLHSKKDDVQSVVRREVPEADDKHSPGLQQAAGDRPRGIADDEQMKRKVYQALKDKLAQGRSLTDKQSNVYRLLSMHFGDDQNNVHDPKAHGNPNGMEHLENQNQNPVPPNRMELNRPREEHGAERQRPAPNNEEEVIQDLVGDGQQKAAEFERGGGDEGRARGPPDEEQNRGAEHRNREGGGDPREAEEKADLLQNHRGDGHVNHPRGPREAADPPHALDNGQPIAAPEKHVQMGRAGGGANKVNNDDEDEEYGAVERARKDPNNAVGNKEHQANKHAQNNKDDGNQAFLDDQQIFEEERRKMRRNEMERNEMRDPVDPRVQHPENAGDVGHAVLEDQRMFEEEQKRRSRDSQEQERVNYPAQRREM